MPLQPSLHSLFIGRPKTLRDERGTWRSSICRDRVEGLVRVEPGSLTGDQVTDLKHHGTPDQAVCVHLLDHYRFWNERYGIALEPGSLGENFVLDGITEEEVCAGDVVAVGSAVFQVSAPRVPCSTQSRRVGRKDWVKLTVRENRTGFYLRVLQPGAVQPGDAWELRERLNPEGTIPALNRVMYLEFDPDFADRVARMPGLVPWWSEQLAQKAVQQAKHWTAGMQG